LTAKNQSQIFVSNSPLQVVAALGRVAVDTNLNKKKQVQTKNLLVRFAVVLDARMAKVAQEVLGRRLPKE
jgi:hypothetical protein